MRERQRIKGKGSKAQADGEVDRITKIETHMERRDKDDVMGREGMMTHSDSEWSEWGDELNGGEERQTYSRASRLQDYSI